MVDVPDARNTTVLVPTNGRPKCVRACIAAVRRNMSAETPITVLDSTPADSDPEILRSYRDVFAEFPDVKVLDFDHSIPPGHARKLLAEDCTTDFVLFMDDDHEILPGSFSVLSTALVDHELDIVAGRWLEEGHVRFLGFIYVDAWGPDGPSVLKAPLAYEKRFDGMVLRADDVPATILCRRSVFDRAQFSEEYTFYFELYDFFYACRQKGVKVGVAVDALFRHTPVVYQAVSTRQTQNRKDDERRFARKWGVEPGFIGIGSEPHVLSRLATRVRKIVRKYR